MDDKQVGRSDDTPLIVIGASAGGLNAIEALVEGIGEHIPITFVLVQHLSPDFRSHMPELLSRKTRLPITVATNSLEMEPGHLYLTPPRSLASIHGNRLEIDLIETGRPPLTPIDHLLTSLADETCPRYAIILSGTGTDGIQGIQQLREHGGVVLVQSPESAGFDGMPRAAIGTGAAHLVMRPELMSQLISHERFGMLRYSDTAELIETWSRLTGLLHCLGQTTGVDFSLYRQTTILRRIERRFDRQRLDRLPAFVELIEQNETARDQLIDDLLISVTSFFRDDDAWLAMGHSIVPKILQQARDGQDRPIRVWSAACSTGQEAYSLAMVFAEAMADLGDPPQVQIFATDVGDAHLLTAKRGLYTPKELEGVSDERRERFFRPQRAGFQVVPELRAMISFSHHNLITDPPFSNLDLVVCRNLLIYMNRETQETVLAKLEFGLIEGGHMFLGSSEDPGALKIDMHSVGTKTGIWRKRVETNRTYLVDTLSLHANVDQTRRPVVRPTQDQLYGKLLELFVKIGVIISQDGEILHSFGSISDFVPMRGAAPFNLLKLISRRASATLATAMNRAQEALTDPVEVLVTLEQDGRPIPCFATVFAVGSSFTDVNSFLVAIEPRGKDAPPDDPEGPSDDENLLRSTEVGVIFLDLDLRIRDFTPAATSLFRMRKHDVGRDINDVRSEIEAADLQAMAQRVANGAEMVEHSLHVGKSDYLVRVHPYRNENEVVEGLVLIVVDVTDFMVAGAAQDDLHRAATWRAAPLPLLSLDAEGQVLDVSDELLAMLDRERADVIGSDHAELVAEEYRGALHEVSRAPQADGIELEYLHRDGSLIPVLFAVRTSTGPRGPIRAAALTRRRRP